MVPAPASGHGASAKNRQVRRIDLLALDAIIAYTFCMQYTLRNVPAFLDRALRQKARLTGASLNDVVLEALAKGAGVTADRVPQRKLSDLAGAWVDDPDFDEALRQQDAIDESIWR